MSNQITSKKQKYIGSKILIDPKTGEEYPIQLNAIEDRDFNFHKVWLQNFIMSMDSIANQKLKLAFWIIENLNKENMLVMTQRKIAEKTGISLRTVSKTIRLLCEPEEAGTPSFLQKINSGAYRVNPNVLFKGSYKNRMGICYEFINTEIENRED
ncbi:replication/maintenance protein RepL [Paraclostridium sp. AKS46]|nr:replication/maintenance protein RepL [Paraclostridium sp. AKS46]